MRRFIKLLEVLKPIHVNNPAFHGWFGQSKVVDHAGHPLLVFRGTRKNPTEKGFGTRRSIPSFTSSPDIASIYASTHGMLGGMPAYERGAQVTPCFLSIQNPIYLDTSDTLTMSEVCEYAKLDWSTDDDFYTVLTILAGLNRLAGRYEFHIQYPPMPSFLGRMDHEELEEALATAYNEDSDEVMGLLDGTEVDAYAVADCGQFIMAAKEKGFDGIIHMDTFEKGAGYSQSLLGKAPEEIGGLSLEDTHLTYRPFSPLQVKAAFNAGTWDPTSTNMMA